MTLQLQPFVDLYPPAGAMRTADPQTIARYRDHLPAPLLAGVPGSADAADGDSEHR